MTIAEDAKAKNQSPGKTVYEAEHCDLYVGLGLAWPPEVPEGFADHLPRRLRELAFYIDRNFCELKGETRHDLQASAGRLRCGFSLSQLQGRHIPDCVLKTFYKTNRALRFTSSRKLLAKTQLAGDISFKIYTQPSQRRQSGATVFIGSLFDDCVLDRRRALRFDSVRLREVAVLS